MEIKCSKVIARLDVEPPSDVRVLSKGVSGDVVVQFNLSGLGRVAPPSIEYSSNGDTGHNGAFFQAETRPLSFAWGMEKTQHRVSRSGVSGGGSGPRPGSEKSCRTVFIQISGYDEVYFFSLGFGFFQPF